MCVRSIKIKIKVFLNYSCRTRIQLIQLIQFNAEKPKMNKPVTYSTKCYTYVCAGCGGLAQTERKDTLTCSPACRVKAHRNGSLTRIRVLANRFNVLPSMMLQTKAQKILRPDLNERLLSGEIDIYSVQGEISKAFTKLVIGIVEAEANRSN
jgi:hypothetical protein